MALSVRAKEGEGKGSTRERALPVGGSAKRSPVRWGPRTTFPSGPALGTCHSCPRLLPQGLLVWPQQSRAKVCGGWKPKPAPAQQVWEVDQETGFLSQVGSSASCQRPALRSHTPDPLALFMGFGLTGFFMAAVDPAERIVSRGAAGLRKALAQRAHVPWGSWAWLSG